MTETYKEKKQRWLLKIKGAWEDYLKVGAVLGIIGGIALWVWSIAIWGLWGFFFGWILAGVLGWFLLRFIWLLVLLAGVFLLFYALPPQMQTMTFKGLVIGSSSYFIIEYHLKKRLLENKKGAKDNED